MNERAIERHSVNCYKCDTLFDERNSERTTPDGGDICPDCAVQGINIAVTEQEFYTIIAALRFYQESGMGDPGNRSDDIHALACNGDDVVSLDAVGIDNLCERINTGGSLQ